MDVHTQPLSADLPIPINPILSGGCIVPRASVTQAACKSQGQLSDTRTDLVRFGGQVTWWSHDSLAAPALSSAPSP